MENAPLSIALCNTLKEFQTDLISYYIATGHFTKEIAVQLADRKLLKKLREQDTDDILHDFHGKCLEDVDMFKKMGKLKTGSDDHDSFYIYKLNCEPSRVFKSSLLMGELALKMDIDTEQGCDNAVDEEYAYTDGMHTRVHGYKTNYVDISSSYEEGSQVDINGV